MTVRAGPANKYTLVDEEYKLRAGPFETIFVDNLIPFIRDTDAFESSVYNTIRVAPDGSGDFLTVKDALDSITDNSNYCARKHRGYP